MPLEPERGDARLELAAERARAGDEDERIGDARAEDVRRLDERVDADAPHEPAHAEHDRDDPSASRARADTPSASGAMAKRSTSTPPGMTWMRSRRHAELSREDVAERRGEHDRLSRAAIHGALDHLPSRARSASPRPRRATPRPTDPGSARRSGCVAELRQDGEGVHARSARRRPRPDARAATRPTRRAARACASASERRRGREGAHAVRPTRARRRRCRRRGRAARRPLRASSSTRCA